MHFSMMLIRESDIKT